MRNLDQKLREMRFSFARQDDEAFEEIARRVVRAGRAERLLTYTELAQGITFHLDKVEDGQPFLASRFRRKVPEKIRENPIVSIPAHLVFLGRVLGRLSGVDRSLDSRLDWRG
jgi:hypothetical protein